MCVGHMVLVVLQTVKVLYLTFKIDVVEGLLSDAIFISSSVLIVCFLKQKWVSLCTEGI